MQDSHTIFRVVAVQRYRQRREQAVLPRAIAPRTFVCLWLLLGLLAAGGILACLTPVPTYASGPAIVIYSQDDPEGMRGQVLVFGFVPPEHLPHVQVGQRVFLHVDSMHERLTSSVVAVEPQLVSPAAVRQRFAPDGGAALVISQPAVVVMTRLQVLPAAMPAATYSGSVGHVDVEVGSRQLLSLVPWIGQIWGSIP